jgi:hypothetical protein
MDSGKNLITRCSPPRAMSGGLKYGPKRYRSMRNKDSEIAVEAQLLDYARRLSQDQQKELVNRLEELSDDMRDQSTKLEPDQKQTLFHDVEDFARRIEAGDYFDGWGWDPRIQEERGWGDESWAHEMDRLFKRANQCFVAGPRSLASEAFARLLGLLLAGDDAGQFCGAKPAERMIDADLNQVRGRYFRCVYEQSPLSQRCQLLFDVLDALYGLGTSALGLQSLIDADKAPLPDMELFLPRWLEFLRSQEHGRKPGAALFQGEQHSQWLLREAVQLEKGIAGLQDLARERGARNPEAYHQWISALIAEKDVEKSVFAAREAAERIHANKDRACMAEVWAELARRADHPGAVLGARRLAFRASPSARRLLEYCAEGNPGQSALRARIKTELEYAETCDEPPSPRLMAVLDLLLGHVELAMQSLEDSSMLGWSSKDHPGHVLFPALLLVSSGILQPESESILARLWSQLDSILGLRVDGPEAHHEIFAACSLEHPNKISVSCRALLEPALGRLRLNKERRRALLKDLQEVTLKRVHSIVGNRFRRAYERASLVSVACAEAFFLTNDKASGLKLLKVIRQDFPRHRAFHKQLSDLQNDSPVLPNSAA